MLDVAHIMTRAFPAIEHRYAARDALLYALSVGYGHDPCDEADLKFLCERRGKVVPTLGSILAYSSDWMDDLRTGVTRPSVLHGEQMMTFHRPLPREGVVRGQMRVMAVLDKGKGKGASITTENVLRCVAGDVPLATIVRTSICRADGGCGSVGPVLPAADPVPTCEPDCQIDIQTSPSQALLYRLNGDYNPLHAWPSAATTAGFTRPILHGLCTYGIACRAILRVCCDNDPAQLADIGARFTAPVYPGETIRTTIWRHGNEIRFEAWGVERAIRVLGNGTAHIAGQR